MFIILLRGEVNTTVRTMADPTIQTFCCHAPSSNATGISLMLEFNTDSYNTVGLVSSSVGILGAIYQVGYNKEKRGVTTLWISFVSAMRRIFRSSVVLKLDVGPKVLALYLLSNIPYTLAVGMKLSYRPTALNVKRVQA